MKYFLNRFFSVAILMAVVMELRAEVPAFTEDGFRVPQPGTELEFPRTHGSHPDYQIEWWYYTGHLQTKLGREFGFQATFFRFAAPLNESAAPITAFGNQQLFSTQIALTDIENQRFLFDERLDRDGWDAKASTEKLSIQHGPWLLEMDDTGNEVMTLSANIRDNARLFLRMEPTKGKVIFGEDGTSRKGPDATARSYYVTFPRLATTGTLVIDGETLEVSGEAWMDHEIASQQLSEDLEGWDWTAIQLDDGREIKAYLLRQQDGSPSPFSRFIWIDQNRNLQYLGPTDFTWNKRETWISPETGTEYPIRVGLEAIDPNTGQLTKLYLEPKLDHQEVRGDLNGTYYWEGACTVLNEAGEPVGQAYLELAGYDDSLEGKLR